MVDIPDPDRPQGVFSEADRRYLNDPEGYKTRQTRHKRENAIPKRIRNAFLDMTILADPDFDPELLDEAFQEPSGETARIGELVGAWEDRDPEVKERLLMDEAIEEAFVDTIALIANVTNWTVYQDIIEEGTKRAIERFSDEHVVKDASYRPEIERPESALKRAKWKVEEGQRLTEEEVVLLLEDGDVDPDAVAKNVREES